MKIFYYKLITVVFLLLSISMVKIYAQDYFGQLTHPSTSDAKFLKIMPSGKMYLGIFGVGLYTSTDNGTSWTASMNGLSNLFVTDLTIKSSDLYISTYSGGIFKSTNFGSDWFAVNNGLSELRVTSLYAYPDGKIFAGTYGNGIFYSVDNGQNWIESNKGLFWKDVTSIAMSKAGFLVIGTFGGGIYRSQDTGKTWIKSSSGLRNQFITKIRSNNTNSSLFAGTNGRGVVQSANDGIAWAELDTNFFYALSADTTALPDLNIASIAFNSKNELVFASRYGGIFFWDNDTYYSFRASDFMGKCASALDRHPSGTLYGVLPSQIVISSTDNGAIWKEKNGPTINWKNPKVFAPKNNKLFIFDSTGVIYMSNDSGKTWTSVKNATKRINQMCIDSIGNYFAAANDGVWKSSNAGASWQKVFLSNDTMALQVQTAPNGFIWMTSRYHKIIDNGPGNPPTIHDIKRVFFSADNGINWVQAPNLTIFKEDPSPNVLGIHPNGDVYVSHGTKFWRSKNNGELWNLTAQATSNEVSGIGFTSTGVIFVTCTEGIFRSGNLGNTFDSIPIKAIGANHVQVTKKNDVYIHFSYNFIGSKEAYAIMKTTDNGAKWQMLVNSYNSEFAQSISSSPDSDVYVTLESGALLKYVEPTTIAAPNLIDLTNELKNVPLNPEFKWNSVGKAELYQIEVSEYDDFSYSWETMTQAANSHKIQRDLLFNTKYYWRVRGKYHASNGAWSEVRTFTTMLEAPKLKSPKNDSVGIPVMANLIWHKSNGATKYHIQVAKDSSFTSPVFVSNNFADSAITTTALEGLTHYYWRVKAASDEAESYWSEIWKFKTVLGPPVLIAPADSSKDLSINLTFKWHPAKLAKNYVLQISEFKEFPIFQEFLVTDTTINLNTFSYNQTYYWRVRSINDEGSSVYSDIWMFTTGFEPPNLISPEQNAVNVAVNTSYTWSKIADVDSYDIQLSLANTFDSLLINDNIAKAEIHNGIKLENYTDYYWRARAKTSDKIGVWSLPNKFKTIVSEISLRIPANNSVNQPIELDFTWFATKGAVKYHLQVANDLIFEDLIFSQDTLSNISMNLNILQPGKSYYWRVRAKSNEGYGAWSEVWTFKTGSNVVVLKAPANNSIMNKTEVTFDWNAIPNATNYYLIVSENADLSNPIIDKNDINVLFYTTTLEFDKKYYWKVKGIISGEETQWSQTWAFEVKQGGSVFESEILNEITANPNPSKDYIILEFDLLQSSNVNLIITDIAGRNLYELPLGFKENGLIKSEIDLKHLSTGTYFIQIVTAKGIAIKEFKVVK